MAVELVVDKSGYLEVSAEQQAELEQVQVEQAEFLEISGAAHLQLQEEQQHNQDQVAVAVVVDTMLLKDMVMHFLAQQVEQVEQDKFGYTLPNIFILKGLKYV